MKWTNGVTVKGQVGDNPSVSGLLLYDSLHDHDK